MSSQRRQVPTSENGTRFSVSNFKARGLTHMTSQTAAQLSTLCMSSKAHGSNPGENATKVEAATVITGQSQHGSREPSGKG